MKRYAGWILTADMVCLFIALFGGWAWVGRHFGVVGFMLVPMVIFMVFVWAADNLDTPMPHDVETQKK